MKKWLVAIAILVVVIVSGIWFSIDKSLRYLILNQPETENVLFWTTGQRDAAFRAIDKIDMLKTNTIEKSKNLRQLQQGKPLAIEQSYLDNFHLENRTAGLVIVHNGEIRMEHYGLDMSPNDKWTTFSVAKSFTSTLVGAALQDGYIGSLQDKVSLYMPNMQGSAYDDVTIEQLLTMTSGIKWNENYSDPQSDVSKFNYTKPEPGLDSTVSYMRQLQRDAQPGARWLYSTGETNLIGVLISQATGKSLSTYLSEKIWQHIGAQQDASWILGPTGHEISGCCIQASPRDFARFGLFVLEGAKVNGRSIVPEGWFNTATTKQADIGRDGQGYGYQWWTFDDGSFEGKGIFGQGIFIDPELNLVIALNSNWHKASNKADGQRRHAFYQAVRDSIRNER